MTMTAPHLPGLGPEPITSPSRMVTASYNDMKRIRDRVAGVGTSVGRPRFEMKGVIAYVRELEPHGAFPKLNNDRARYEEVYLARLDKHAERIDEILAELHARTELPLALLCWCKLDRPGHPQNWCHRHMLAGWLETRTGLAVPEVQQ